MVTRTRLRLCYSKLSVLLINSFITIHSMNDKEAWVNNSAGSTVVFRYEFWYLSSLILHTAAAWTVRPQLGRSRNGQATLLPVLNIYCVLLIISLSVFLSFLWITLLEFSETPLLSLLKTVWRDMWATGQSFWNGEKTVGDSCSVLPNLPACPFNTAPTGTSLTVQKVTNSESRPSHGWLHIVRDYR